jgi:mannose-6-phosphate isomerase-like protein (cupin superfamily)
VKGAGQLRRDDIAVLSLALRGGQIPIRPISASRAIFPQPGLWPWKSQPLEAMNITAIHQSAKDFQILETTGRTQTATMTLKPGEASGDGMNSHPHSDQTVLVLEGELVAEVGEERAVLQSGQSLIVPAGVKHRFTNKSKAKAFAFTLYAPPAYETGDPH